MEVVLDRYLSQFTLVIFSCAYDFCLIKFTVSLDGNQNIVFTSSSVGRGL